MIRCLKLKEIEREETMCYCDRFLSYSSLKTLTIDYDYVYVPMQIKVKVHLYQHNTAKKDRYPRQEQKCASTNSIDEMVRSLSSTLY